MYVIVQLVQRFVKRRSMQKHNEFVAHLDRAKAPATVVSEQLSPLYPKAKDIGFYGAFL